MTKHHQCYNKRLVQSRFLLLNTVVTAHPSVWTNTSLIL